MTEEERAQEQLTSMLSNDKDIADAIDSLNFDFGLNYNWNQNAVVEGVSASTSQQIVLQCFNLTLIFQLILRRMTGLRVLLQKSPQTPHKTSLTFHSRPTATSTNWKDSLMTR
jgi:hypothetical protein